MNEPGPSPATRLGVRPAASDRPRVGLVVPCRNERGTIERCLQAIAGQTYPVARLLVMDNGSTDGSDLIAARFGDVVHCPELRCVSAMRNRGAARLGDVDVVGFVDADCEVDRRWVEIGLDLLATGDLVGARSQAPADGTWVARRWARIEAATAGENAGLWSQNLLIRRARFEALGGFDESLPTTEDADLCRRLRRDGGVVTVSRRFTVIHHGFAPTLSRFVRRELWHTSTPTWFEVMSPRSRAVVLGVAAWSAVGAGCVVESARRRSPAAALVWLGVSATATVAVGGITTRDYRHAAGDGLLIGLWALVRAARLLRLVNPPFRPSCAR